MTTTDPEVITRDYVTITVRRSDAIRWLKETETDLHVSLSARKWWRDAPEEFKEAGPRVCRQIDQSRGCRLRIRKILYDVLGRVPA